MKNNFNLLNVHKLIASSSAELTKAGLSSARLDSLVLLAHVIGHEKTWLLTHPEAMVAPKQIADFELHITRRAENFPVAYLVEHKEFYGRDFKITPDVLVPRPETEDMVEQVLGLGSENETVRVIDIGTGSGIIAITLAVERPKWDITATDVSKQALKVALSNARLHNVQTRITCANQDLLAKDDRPYDIVVANLPYVPDTMKGKPDIAHEPQLALFAGPDGLELYRVLFARLSGRTQRPLHIFTEALTAQHSELTKLAIAAGYKPAASQGLIQHFIATG